MVMHHEIEPGARVGIESPARTLDVSPTPVREARARLESDGLVTKRSARDAPAAGAEGPPPWPR